DAAVVDRVEDGTLDARIPDAAAPAEVDHAGAGGGGALDPLDRGGGEDPTRRLARVEAAKVRLRIDAEQAGAVLGRGDDGGGCGPVLLLATERRLGVEHGGVGPPREVGIGGVDAAVDDGDRHTGPRRVGAVGAHV